MRLRLTYAALGIVIALGASALVYQFEFGPGKLHASRPQASATQVAPLPVESPRPALLAAAWSGYKDRFIQPDGRVIDFQRAQVTTSEGQSYAMLRAVWMNDRPTFDLTWRWTQDNLGDPARSRIGWLWGKSPDGSWRLLDANSASDADEDIALALLFAAHQWTPTYRPAAIALLGRIWDEDVATVAGQPYLAAGNWAPGAAGGPVLLSTPDGTSSRERRAISALTAWFCSIHGASRANSHRNTHMTARSAIQTKIRPYTVAPSPPFSPSTGMRRIK